MPAGSDSTPARQSNQQSRVADWSTSEREDNEVSLLIKTKKASNEGISTLKLLHATTRHESFCKRAQLTIHFESCAL
jgi:hypothetical protein